MARYEYRCSQCGYVGECQHGIGLPVFVACPYCHGLGERYFSADSVFYHVEDRRHMRRGLSPATGREYAQSRREERVIERERGIEFISPREMPSQWTTLREHYQHTKQGGEALSPNVLNPPPSPKVEPGTIMRMVREKGIKLKP